MNRYPKLENLFVRDEKTHKPIIGTWKSDTVCALRNMEWLWHEKIDGTNIRVHWDGEKVIFGGRTENAQIPAPLIEVLIALFPADKFADRRDPLTLFGEGYGSKIQKGGGRYAPEPRFILFDAQIDSQFWIANDGVCEIADDFGLDKVPCIGAGTLHDAISKVQSRFASEVAEDSILEAEGLVVRTRIPLQDYRGHPVVAKIKRKDF